ncbi:hypothetical protein EJ05DRAFT_160854 [Pseudovirgaria hyperparasitica]|uniref:Uncharacterized protein n=1 Tax=Pseudovirgaria hyperparasitica TaxID=470096 RepID=A0A6A6VVY4_9PEZI|nr:uncharacterized protein EJ05DRAFT_160854 [Pseudovirgaria hyperparasitica]KAF2753956.1 hypothetical protein EJ05DRAFT_160854 [Pseudovirgaria hyperparasitica]
MKMREGDKSSQGDREPQTSNLVPQPLLSASCVKEANKSSLKKPNLDRGFVGREIETERGGKEASQSSHGADLGLYLALLCLSTHLLCLYSPFIPDTFYYYACPASLAKSSGQGQEGAA